jgi:hypothetical protein
MEKVSREERLESSEEKKGNLVQNLGHLEGFRAGGNRGRRAKREAEKQEEELIVPKKGLFLAFLGLFLQTKGGVEEQKLGNGVV